MSVRRHKVRDAGPGVQMTLGAARAPDPEPVAEHPREPDVSVAEIVRVVTGHQVVDGWTYDRPRCGEDGVCPVCSLPGTEVARHVVYMHATCVRVVASMVQKTRFRLMVEQAHGRA